MAEMLRNENKSNLRSFIPHNTAFSVRSFGKVFPTLC